jgi:hypothetical protein
VAVIVAGTATLIPLAPRSATTVARAEVADAAVPDLLRRVHELELRLGAAEARAERAESLARVAAERRPRGERRAPPAPRADDPPPGVIWHRAPRIAVAPADGSPRAAVARPPQDHATWPLAASPTSGAMSSERPRPATEPARPIVVVDTVRVAARSEQTVRPVERPPAVAEKDGADRAALRFTGEPEPGLGERLRSDWRVMKRELQAAGAGIGRSVAGLTRKAREALDLD